MTKLSVVEIKNRLYDSEDQKTKGWLSALPKDTNKFIWEKAIWNSYKKCPNARLDDFVECSLKAVRDGLVPDGREAVILPYKRKRKQGNQWIETGEVTLTYIPMIAGVIKRIYSGQIVKRIIAHIVHDHDDFDIWTDKNGDDIRFRPLLKGSRGLPIGAFAMAFLSNGETIIRYMSKEDIEKRRRESKAGNRDDSPWVKWWDEMAKKTVIHNMFKTIPLENNEHEMLLDSIDAPDKMDEENEMIDVTNQYEADEPEAPKPHEVNALIDQSENPFGGDDD